MKTTKTRTGTINGCHFMYDVSTKAKIVDKYLAAARLLRTTCKDMNEFKLEIKLLTNDIASDYRVTPITIKAWVKKYYYTYSDYIKLPDGVLRMANSIISGKSTITKVQDFLAKQRLERDNLAKSLDPMYEQRKGFKLSFDELAEMKKL